MSVFFHHHTLLKETVSQSAMNTIIKVEKQWLAAGIPTCERKTAAKKLQQLFFKWKILLKSRNKKTSAKMKNQSLFQEKLSELFDISDQKSCESMDHEKKLFLEGQKKQES